MNTIPAYQLDKDGFYLGPTVADESPKDPGHYLFPAGCIGIEPPPDMPGKIQRYTVAGGWQYVDITTPVTPPDASASTRAEILARLAAIDADSIRPLRAILTNTATDADRQKLANLESEAATLRGELANL